MDTITDFVTKIADIIKDEKPYLETSDEIESHIVSALNTYSKDRPINKPKEYTGDAGYDYDLPTDWVDGFSDIVDKIEYPSGEQDPTYMAFEDWIIYEDESGKVLRFLQDSPSASETFLIKYIIPHTLSDSESTVYADDEIPLCYLASSLCLRAIANRVLQSADSTIDADVVEYRTKPDMYATRAKELLKIYTDHMFETEPMKAVVLTKEFDTGFLWGGRHLTHDPSYR